MLFLISLDYRQPLDAVDRHLDAHRTFLQHHYDAGHFVLSGAKHPRTGGMILARAESREDVVAWIAEDPFHQQGIARYEVTGWMPTLSAPGWPRG